MCENTVTMVDVALIITIPGILGLFKEAA